MNKSKNSGKKNSCPEINVVRTHFLYFYSFNVSQYFAEQCAPERGHEKNK